MEAVFIDDMDSILVHVIGLNYDDPNLSVGQHNIARLIMIGIEHSALKCLKVLLNQYDKLGKQIGLIDLYIQKVLKRETDQVSKDILDLMFTFIFEKAERNTDALQMALIALSSRDDSTEE